MDRRNFIALLTSFISSCLGGVEQLLRYVGLSHPEVAKREPGYADFYHLVPWERADNIFVLAVELRRFRDTYGDEQTRVELHLPLHMFLRLAKDYRDKTQRYIGAGPLVVAEFYGDKYLTMFKEYYANCGIDIHFRDDADNFAEALIRGTADTERYRAERKELQLAYEAEERRQIMAEAIAYDTILPFRIRHV